MRVYPLAMEPGAIAAFILAGGKSTRMGTDKAFVLFQGRTLLERVMDVARSVTTNTYVVGDAAKFASYAPVIEDVFQNCGPLGGIHAALRASRFELNLILAVDLPFISVALLQYLVARAMESSALVTVPRATRGSQPLCAIYRRGFVEIAESSLRAGRYKIDTLFEPERTQVITEEELEAAGFSPDLFQNLNSPADLAKASETPASGENCRQIG